MHEGDATATSFVLVSKARDEEKITALRALHGTAQHRERYGGEATPVLRVPAPYHGGLLIDEGELTTREMARPRQASI